jgi:Fic family protein
LIKEIHQILTGGTYDEHRYIVNEERPGQFKKHDYVTDVHEVGTAAANVANELAELVAEVNGYEGKDVLKAATYLHARFEFIHPFADGNGRVGRTLMNYYLMTHDHPPLIVYNEDKRMYYEFLEKYDEIEELNPLYEFFQIETKKTWGKTLALAEGTGWERTGLSGFTI